MKFMLAADWDPKKVKYPVIAEPKIDGVRAGNLNGRLTGRSLKEHKNRYITEFFSNPLTLGFDGEMAAEVETHSDLRRLTSSAMGTIAGTPWLMWHVFDFVDASSLHMPYGNRLQLMSDMIIRARQQHPELGLHLRPIRYQTIRGPEEMRLYIEWADKMGYEGVCFRDPNGLYVEKRSSPSQGGLLRIVLREKGEGIVVGWEESEKNLNEAFLDERGYTARTSHKENKVGNGMVGTLIVKVKGYTEPQRISAGRATHDERAAWFKDPSLIMGKTVCYEHKPHGMKDALSQATYQHIRDESDIGADE